MMTSVRWRSLRWGLVGLLAVVAAFAGDAPPAPLSGGGADVKTVRPEKKIVSHTLVLPTQVEAAERAEMYAGVAGRVESVSVRVGDRVRKGDVLAELDVPEARAVRKAKVASVALAEAQVGQAGSAEKQAAAQLDLGLAGVEEAEAAAKRARANHELRRAALKRAQQLAAQQSVTQSLADEKAHEAAAAEAAFAAAEAAAKAARANRDALTAARASAEGGVRVAEAQLAVARAELEQAEAILSAARVRAPFDGTVTRRAADPGDWSGPPDRASGPMLVVSRAGAVRVVVPVPERYAAFVTPAASAVVRPDAQGGERFPGKVTRVAGALDSATRTMRAEIDLPNPDGRLLPGMFATVSLTIERKAVWALPAAALTAREGTTFCFLVRGGRPVETPVRVGLAGGGLVEVLKKGGAPATPGGEAPWEDFTGEEVVLADAAAKRAGPPEGGRKAAQPADGADLAALSKARLEAARKAYEAASADSFAEPAAKVPANAARLGAEPEQLYRWSVRWLEAERASGGPKGGRAALEAHLKRMKDLEQRVAALRKLGLGASVLDSAAAEYYRTEAELWLAAVKPE